MLGTDFRTEKNRAISIQCLSTRRLVRGTDCAGSWIVMLCSLNCRGETGRRMRGRSAGLWET